MRAWAVVENEKPLQEMEMPTPEPTGTEVLLQTTYCGVCHSDIHIWEGRYDLGGGKVMNLKDRGLTLPLAMGHEIVGRVVKLGPQATGVKPGDIRIVYPWVGCGTCAAPAARAAARFCSAISTTMVLRWPSARSSASALRPSPPAPRCCSRPPTAGSATPTSISGRGVTTLAAAR